MALPAIDRAIMMNKENLSNYSEEQRDIISNLIDRGTSKDINFYNKIQDAGRMELAKQSFLTQYNEILRDPNSFNMYVQRAKQAASDVLTKKKYESIDKISDYKDFALEMDKLMDNGSPREQRLIINALSKSNNSNYERYKNDRKTLEGLFNQIVNDDAFRDIDANDADMFALSLQYLSNNGVDLNDENAVVVADTSGSMYWCSATPKPISVAFSLAIYFAERNSGDFKNHFITFSCNPQFIEIKGKDIYEKVKYCETFAECANTDIQAVFDLVLSTAVKNKTLPEDMPSKLYIISDMEFDYCAENSDVTNFEYAKEKFEQNGYALPKVVFWNVASRNMQSPVEMNEQGVTLVSGCNPRIFSMVTEDKCTPYEYMLDVLNQERYADIKA